MKRVEIEPYNAMLIEHISHIQEGYSEGLYQGKKYGITKTVFNDGKSFKVYAKELGGNDFISLNYYVTACGEKLRPCEMPERKVVHFLRNVELN